MGDLVQFPAKKKDTDSEYKRILTRLVRLIREEMDTLEKIESSDTKKEGD